MRPITLLAILAIAAVPLSVQANPPTVNVLSNPGFEVGFEPVADALEGSALDVDKGIGRQALGCAGTASIVWSGGCNGPDDPVNETVAVATNPGAEAEFWLADGFQEGDLVLVAPAEQSPWHAAAWAIFPHDTIDVRDQGGDLDREARIKPGNQMLYQSFASPSLHTAVPAGLVQSATLRFEAGAPAGSFVLVLNGFPFESATALPQAFVTYQLRVPASAWTFVDGVATIDPLAGTLSGPAPGAHVGVPPPLADDHPTAAQWSAASREERRAILMELRITQMTFWNLPVGAIVDDAALNVGA